MPEKKPDEAAAQATAEHEPRAVAYVAFAELRPGLWSLIADREATSIFALRKQLRAEIAAAQLDAGVAESATHNLLIVPKEHAHFMQAAQQVRVEETFQKIEPGVSDVRSMIIPPHPETDADVAARMGAETAPEGAVAAQETSGAVAETGEPETPFGTQAASEAVERAAIETAAVAAEEAEFTGNPDLDPLTGVSKRPASEATAADEATTIFPMDERE